MSQGKKMPIQVALASALAGMGGGVVVLRPGPGFRRKPREESPAKPPDSIMAFQRNQKARRKARGV